MSTEKTYKVTFKGVICPGFDKDLVIKNIHNITRIPESTIARKFFSGKTVVIRHADSQDYANHLQKTFAQAGIETYIAEIHDTKDVEEPCASDLNNITHNNKSKPEKTRTLKLIYTVTGIIIIAILISYFLTAEPEATNKIVKPNPLPVEIKPVGTKKAPAKNNAVTIINTKNHLLLITQDKADFLFTDKSHDINFKPETIITLNKNYSAKAIKNYQNNLDIEFNAQWQSGPFAISTNKFIFDKKISIELLAKGQNIANMMEYSCAASINTESVLNNNGENILLKNRADKPLNKVCFKNHDGELEAYIDNDFVSYTSISATNKITLKADSMISDIKQINGTITLQLADKILNKSFNLTKLQNSEQQKTQQFEHFAIQFQTHEQKNSLKYHIIGDINRFITLRGYNKSGEILDTVLFKRKKILNNQITVYVQEFSEDIDHIIVFYTNRNNILTFPFALKPSIVPGKTPLDGDDIEETGFIMTGDKNIPEFSSLGDAILQDNPNWLGVNKAQTRLLPFYISFFTQSEFDNMHDAVLNIKAALSPYISQNLSAVRVILNDKQNTLIDNFVLFTSNEFIDGKQSVNSDGSIMAPKIMAYLNSNSAFQIHKNNIDELHGELTFNLPAVFKTHSRQYFPSGQSIKTDDLILTLTQIDKHQVQFKIKGNIAKIVQLKLYNKQEKLISEPFEFKIINKNTALLTLRYNDQIDSIKLVLSQETVVKNYIFSLKNNKYLTKPGI